MFPRPQPNSHHLHLQRCGQLMVRLHLLDTTGGDTPPQSWRYANLDRVLMTSLLSAFALIILLYMLYQCVCQPIARLPDRSRLCRDHHPIDARIERLKSIPVVCYGDSSPPSSRVGDKTCPVCLAEFVQGEELRVLPNCGHLFHRECIDRWLLHGSWLCPICREPPAIARDGGGIAIAVAEQSRRPRSSC